MRPAPTLFERLFRAQILSALALLLVFGSAFYVERNRTVARLTAQRWAPALRIAAGLPSAGPGADAPSPQSVQVADERPHDTMSTRTWAPRIAALRATLRAEGLDVREVVFAPHRGRPMT